MGAHPYDALDRLTKVTREEGGAVVGVEDYAYNALGALSVNAGVALDTRRPRLDGAGLADSAVPATLAGQPVVLDAAGRVTSLAGATLRWSHKGFLREEQETGPVLPARYGVDAQLRRFGRFVGTTFATTTRELYVYEGLDRVATVEQVGSSATGVVTESWVFDGIDHPLRIRQGGQVAYYELDLAGNVRALRASGGADLGGYRYAAFGKTVEDTATTAFDQPLRWKGRWHATLDGVEVYDVRARQWAPDVGAFLSIDSFKFHRPRGTLWGWPGQNPVTWSDKTGHLSDRDICLLTQIPVAIGTIACVIAASESVVGIAVCLGVGVAVAAAILSQCPPPDPSPGISPRPPEACPSGPK